MLSQRLEALPYTKKVALKIAENVSLPTSVRGEALELVGAVSELGDDLGSTLSKPGIGLPPQEDEDTSHLFPQK